MEQVISSYLLKLRRVNPFLATLSLMARYRFDDRTDRFNTDGHTIRINTSYFNTLKDAERTGLLLHLTLHAALLHPIRIGSRNAAVWNMAADIVVNNIISEAGDFIPPPHTATEPKYHDLSVEQVYEALQSLHQKHPALNQSALQMPASETCAAQTGAPPSQSQSTATQANEYQRTQLLKQLYPHHSDLKTNTQTAAHTGQQPPPGSPRAEAIAQHWQGALRKAEVANRMTCQGRGEVPAGLMLEIGHMLEPELDWRMVLWQFVVRTPDDFHGFDRRFMHQGLYLDQLESERLNVTVAVDTSGSIDPDELTRFMSEVMAIQAAYDFIQVELYYVDADIYGPYPLSDGLEQAPPQGGGGTDFEVFFDQLEQHPGPHPTDLVIYFTDGDGSFPTTPPQTDTLWVVVPGGATNDEFPFGTVARLANQTNHTRY
jgi:predicted metal-dependent peptidase